MTTRGHLGICETCGGDVVILEPKKEERAIVFLCPNCEDRIFMQGKEQGYLEGAIMMENDNGYY